MKWRFSIRARSSKEFRAYEKSSFRLRYILDWQGREDGYNDMAIIRMYWDSNYVEWYCTLKIWISGIIGNWQLDVNLFSYLSDAASRWAARALVHPEFWSSVNPEGGGGHIMPTTLLLAHSDLKTQRHLCIFYKKYQGIQQKLCAT